MIGLLAGAAMLVTGYDDRGLTADGEQARPGVIACPAWLPFGATIEIVGLGTFHCADRYAGYLSDRFDVFEPTAADCYAITGRYEWRRLS